MEFNKNILIEKTINTYLDTWSTLIDTEDFVKKRYIDRMDRLIYSNFKKKVKEINVYYWLYLESKGIPLSIFKRFIIWLSGLRPVCEMEQKELAKKEQEKAERAKVRPKKKRTTKVVKE